MHVPDQTTLLCRDVAEVDLNIKLGQEGLLMQEPVKCIKARTQVDNLTLLVG